MISDDRNKAGLTESEPVHAALRARPLPQPAAGDTTRAPVNPESAQRSPFPSPTPSPLLPPVPIARPAAKSKPGGNFQPPILIATADLSLSRMLGFALEQLRLPHKILYSGSVALRELLSMNVGAQPPIVVLDIDLPGVDGHAILERLGVSRPDTFLIVVLSSHADESVQVRSLLAGAIDHLAKPFNVRVLMAKVQRWTTIASRFARSA